MTTRLSCSDSSKEVLEETSKSGERAVRHSAAAEISPYSWSPYSWTYLSCSWEKFWKRITRESLDFLLTRTSGSSKWIPKKMTLFTPRGESEACQSSSQNVSEASIARGEKKWEWEAENLRGQEEWGVSNVGLLLTGHCLATLFCRFYIHLKVTY